MTCKSSHFISFCPPTNFLIIPPKTYNVFESNEQKATKVTSPLPNPKGKKPAAVPAAPPALQPPPAAVEGGIKFADVPGEPLPPQQETKSRKDKSLGVLCVNFMKLFEDKPPNRDNNGQVIEISAVADFLQVKRRRIYDVINILESIDVVCRVKKNTYRWHGVDNLPRYFAELQKAGLEERAASEAVAAVAAAGGEAAVPAGAKTKGMAQTCQKLIQIFLVSGRTEIGLTEAAEEVLGPLSPAEEANAAKAMKTKVRRMYDIANVLQSLGILQKENVGSTSLQNKPSFRWVYRIEPTAMGDYLSTGTRPMVDVRATAHSSAPPVGSAAPLLPEGAVELPVVTPADVVAAAESAATAAALAEPPVAPEQPAEEQNVSMQV